MPPEVFAHDGSVVPVIDGAVEAIRRRLASWGIAGRRAYWQPILRVHVADDAQHCYDELVILLQDSGLPITRDP
jgi:hypothetical protein